MFSSLVSPRERLFQFFVQRKTFLLFGKLREFLRPMSMRRGCIDVHLSIRRANLATLHGSHRHGGGCGQFADYGFRSRDVLVPVKASSHLGSHGAAGNRTSHLRSASL